MGEIPQQENYRQKYIVLTPIRRQMLEILSTKFIGYYNKLGICFGGDNDSENALVLRFFLEGCRKYGMEEINGQLYFDEEKFNAALR